MFSRFAQLTRSFLLSRKAGDGFIEGTLILASVSTAGPVVLMAVNRG
jgi:hypothetical protein